MSRKGRVGGGVPSPLRGRVRERGKLRIPTNEVGTLMRQIGLSPHFRFPNSVSIRVIR